MEHYPSLVSEGANSDTQGNPTGAAGEAHNAGAIRIRNLRKVFSKSVVAVDDFSLQVGQNEVIALLGPSGCGKTTTLRCIAGLLDADEGSVEVDSQVVFSAAHGLSLPPERRGLSMVFQQYALWPHMDVFDNVAFGLRVRRASKQEVQQQTEAALRQVQLWEMRDRRISQLSGGQQQRIALARAIAFQPKVVLFDEPLSNLDAKLREEMRFELLAIQRRLGFTAIYVTHDQGEAISLASRIVVMNNGVIEQVGTPREVWSRPASGFVARFIGSSNRFMGHVSDHDHRTRTLHVQSDDGLQFSVSEESYMGSLEAVRIGKAVEVYAKMRDIMLTESSPAAFENPNVWKATIQLISFNGDATDIQLALGGGKIMARGPADTMMREGDTAHVTIDPRVLACYPLD